MSVYTSITQSQLNHFIEPFNIGALQKMEPAVNGVENTNYFVTTDKDRYVLTIFEELSKNDLPFFIQLTQTLSTALPVPAPLVDKDGTALKTLEDKPAMLAPFFKGVHIDQPTHAQCQALGSSLATLHLTLRDFPLERENNKSIQSWKEQISTLKKGLNPTQAALLKTALGVSHDAMLFAQQKNLASGIIHGDLFRDNALFDGDSLCGIIDFYNACNDYFIYDLAICVNDWCITPEGYINTELCNAILDAYGKIRPFCASEKTIWNKMLVAAATRFWCSRLLAKQQCTEDESQQKDPQEFYQRVKNHLASI